VIRRRVRRDVHVDQPPALEPDPMRLDREVDEDQRLEQ
jgi:hypothetical protein